MKNLIYFIFLSLAACSSLPPAIEDPPAYDLSYQEAVSNTGKFTNAPVRWGGKIVEVENEPTYSMLQILYYPVSKHGRPDIDKTGEGRFAVKSPSFLDPAIYKKDTPVTIAGNLAGETERKVGNKPLKLPVVTATHIHIWQADDYYYPGGYYGGFGYGYGGPYPYGGFYGYGPYYPGSPYGYGPYFRGGYYSPYGWRR